MRSFLTKIIAGLIIICEASVIVTAQSKPTVPNPYKQTDIVALAMPSSDINSVETIAEYIRSHFNTESDKARAAFAWVTGNISYDIDNMFAFNFYATKEEKLKKVLITRKGICEHFALLFTAICNQLGIEGYIVEGNTKQNGFTDYIPHVWSAARIDNNWYLFDPTWGSGYILNKKFVKKLNNEYYKVNPEKLIKSHMPFDYLWQFLNYPITTAQFYENKAVQDKNGLYFSYIDSITAYNTAGLRDQLQSTVYRIEKNGIRNSMIYDRLHHIKTQLENLKISERNQREQAAVDSINQLTGEYNETLVLFNKYIDYRNHQFTPSKSDAEIRSMYTIPAETLIGLLDRLQKTEEQFPNVTTVKKNLLNAIANLQPQLKEHKEWLEEYLAKSKRKSMFYERKLTWFGIPIN